MIVGVSVEDRVALEARVVAATSQRRVWQRAKIVLLAAEGWPSPVIGRVVGLNRNQVDTSPETIGPPATSPPPHQAPRSHPTGGTPVPYNWRATNIRRSQHPVRHQTPDGGSEAVCTVPGRRPRSASSEQE